MYGAASGCVTRYRSRLRERCVSAVTFLSAERLTMVREFIPQVEPGCVHRHEYTGAFKWFR